MKSETLLSICATALLLTGCAAVTESIYKMGMDEKPENAPPGYYNYKVAQNFEKQNALEYATTNYCNAAELGHPKAKAKCIQLSYKAALQNPKLVCSARYVDDEANRICVISTQDPLQAQKAVRAYLNKQERVKVRARIEKGEFSEFKAEEF